MIKVQLCLKLQSHSGYKTSISKGSGTWSEGEIRPFASPLLKSPWRGWGSHLIPPTSPFWSQSLQVPRARRCREKVHLLWQPVGGDQLPPFCSALAWFHLLVWCFWSKQHVCVCAFVYVMYVLCICVCVCICMWCVYMCVFTNAYMYVCVYVCICVFLSGTVQLHASPSSQQSGGSSSQMAVQA